MQIPIPPLNFTDVSIAVALAAIILLATAQLSPYWYKSTDVTVDKKKLEKAALAAGILFLATVVIRVIGIIQGI